MGKGKQTLRLKLASNIFTVRIDVHKHANHITMRRGVACCSDNPKLTPTLNVLPFVRVLEVKPKKVIHLAAIVGGVHHNIEEPVKYFEENILMNTFMLKESFANNVENFLGILSSCIYPDDINEYPIGSFSPVSTFTPTIPAIIPLKKTWPPK